MTSKTTGKDSLGHIVIRSYRPTDQAMVSHLYDEGLLAGTIDPNDTGADIENMQEAYMSDPLNHFWVAELDDQVVGMIGVSHDHKHTAQVRRLRVHKTWQHTVIAARLVETALAYCRKIGYLKVVFDTRLKGTMQVDLFSRFGFQYNRTRTHHGRDLPEFYLDLYRGKKTREQE